MFSRNMKSLALGMALSVTMAGGVMADDDYGTLAGTDVKNTISLTYSTGGVGAVDDADVVSLEDIAEVTFTVDTKIDLLVTSTATAGETPVIPGTTAAVLPFTLTNLGNGPQRFQLSVEQTLADADEDLTLTPEDTATATPAVGRYSFIVGSTDNVTTAVPYSVGDIPTLQPGRVQYIWIVANVPTLTGNGAFNEFRLTASAHDPDAGDGLLAEVRTALLDGNNIVFADVASTSILGNDVTVDFDGSDANDARLKVTAPVLSASKEVVVLHEGLTGTTFDCSTNDTLPATPLAAIPGACVQYTITVFNAAESEGVNIVGAVKATNIEISDELPENVDYAGNTPGDFIVSETNGIVTAELSELEAGQSRSFTIRAEIK